MTQDEAVAIARRFAAEKSIELGPLFHIGWIGPETYRRWGGPPHGQWTIVFKDAGPPIEPDPTVVHSVGPNSPTGIGVDDVTGEAFLHVNL